MIESPKGDEARSPDLVVFTVFTFGYFGISVAVGKVRRVPQLNNIFRGFLIINRRNSIWGKFNL